MSVRVGALGDNVRWVGSDGTTWSDDSLTERVFASGERVSVLKGSVEDYAECKSVALEL